MLWQMVMRTERVLNEEPLPKHGPNLMALSETALSQAAELSWPRCSTR